MILPIVAYGDPVLRKECKEVDPENAEIQELISNMWETMYNAKGIGLAAPQVGEAVRVFIIDTEQLLNEGDEEDPIDEEGIKQTFINPVIVERAGEEWAYNEGCLSIPDIREDIDRPCDITIKYLNKEGKEEKQTFTGINARVIQHEYDHVEGILFTDYLKPLKKRLLKKKLEKISRGKISVHYKMRYPMLKKK